jgi:hypothetical protein
MQHVLKRRDRLSIGVLINDQVQHTLLDVCAMVVRHLLCNPRSPYPPRPHAAVIGVGLSYKSGAHAANASRWAFGSGNLVTRRFIIQGAEDPGAGTQTLFKLESGFLTEQRVSSIRSEVACGSTSG